MTDTPPRPHYVPLLPRIVALALVVTLLWILVVVSIAVVDWAGVDGVTAVMTGLGLTLLAIGVVGFWADRPSRR